MARLDEGLNDQSQMVGGLNDGLDAVSLNSEEEFQLYSRYILPIDGYVFWQPTVTKKLRGSLHYAQEIQQSVDETVGYATVRFTSKHRIVEFEESPTNTLFVGCKGKFRYAFSQQVGVYQANARLWHYLGHSIYPAMESQFLDRPGMLDITRAVTSNSLALWIQLNNYTPIFWDGFANKVPIFPSKLVQQNLVPPYAVVNIDPNRTRALQSTTLLTRNRSSYQLCADVVTVTLYGLQSDEAEDFLNCVNQYSLNTGNFGIMNMPCIRDGQREQPETEVIAMQKFIDFEVDYNQTRVDNVARQLIQSVPVTYQLNPNP